MSPVLGIAAVGSVGEKASREVGPDRLTTHLTSVVFPNPEVVDVRVAHVPGRVSVRPTVAVEELSDVLSEFARTMVTNFPIQGILDHLVKRIVEIMPFETAVRPETAAARCAYLPVMTSPSNAGLAGSTCRTLPVRSSSTAAPTPIAFEAFRNPVMVVSGDASQRRACARSRVKMSCT
jgi:hypothetical protein